MEKSCGKTVAGSCRIDDLGDRATRCPVALALAARYGSACTELDYCGLAETGHKCGRRLGIAPGEGGGLLLVGKDRVDVVVEQMLEEQTKGTQSIGSQTSSTPAPVSTTTAAKPVAAIYDQACNEVVGITTEVTYTNFFGQTSSSAVSGS